jgi:hypothetical protein
LSVGVCSGYRSSVGRLAESQCCSRDLALLAGCAISEVAGMVIGIALGWSKSASIALAMALAFVFG